MSHARTRAAPQPGTIRIHYARRDGHYQTWGVHAWGPALNQPRAWQDPLHFQDVDDYGAFVDIAVDDLARKLSFIVHRSGEKDLSSDRALTDMVEHREYWLKQGRADIWTTRPQAAIELIRAELNTPTELVALADDDLAQYERLYPELAKKGGPYLSLRAHDGEVVAIRHEKREGRIVVAQLERPLDLSKNYFASLGISSTPAYLSGPLLDSHFVYGGDDLGATLVEGAVTFKVWSPPAVRVAVHLYDKKDPGREIGVGELSRGDRGVWSGTVAADAFGDLEGCFYQYEVTAYGKTERALDPYAKSMAAFSPSGDDAVGKAAIVDPRRADPEGFADDRFSNLGRPRPERREPGPARLTSEADLVAYELHVRDFTIDPESQVPERLRGTYLGFLCDGPLDYLAQLGVTHVQLMPVQMFHTVEESDRGFRDGNKKDKNYNWGYDPKNYFTPSGWYSTDASDPYARIGELKLLVQGLHARGIGVILDVVFNHTYETQVFENVAPGCYYRLEGEGLVSNRTGAGPSVETRRRMVRKLIVDSMRYFAREYHVDGFRFDLMGFLDHETMVAAREALGPDVLLQGEAWDLTDLPFEQATTKRNLPEGARVAAFSDSTRDAVTGRMAGRGFVQGMTREAPRVRAGLMGNLEAFESQVAVSDSPYERFAKSPQQTLNYLTIHDGFTLWDKLSLSYPGTPEEIARLARLATAMLFTAQGRLILHGGDELGRTKPLARFDPSPDRAHGSAELHEQPDLPGVGRFHENSYASPDFTNMIRWGRLEREPFRSLAAYTAGLVRLRRALPGLRYASGEQVRKALRFLGKPVQLPAPPPSMLAGYRSFAQVPELTVQFINGPANKVCYLVGEVLGKGAESSKNPPYNPFRLHFDERGDAAIRFSRGQIEDFDLDAWGDPEGLQFKLVYEPGKWNTVFGAYSTVGSNSVRPEAIRKDLAVVIDLAAEDHAAGNPAVRWSNIAYEIDNTLHAEQPSQYDRLLVVHNADRGGVTVEVPELEDPSGWRVLVDASWVDVDGLAETDVAVRRQAVSVPPQSSAVVARLARR